ncbi:MAG: flagellar filament capping protein FliD [Anaeromyxobacter sp.]
MAGRYSVQVGTLAKAAKWRSDATGFASTDVVQGGQLTLSVQGKTYDPITITDGASLADVAYAIRNSGAPVSAVVLSDGTRSYLSLTARDTGHPIGQDPSTALGVAFTPANGATGRSLGLYQAEAATNATFTVDSLQFTRTSNTVSDAVPGTTLTLSKEGGAAEDLIIGQDADGTKARLDKFVSAYNGAMKLVQRQLAVNKDTDRAATLAGDGAVRALQSSLQRVITTQVGSATVRTLADLGLKTARDGSLSIDTTLMKAALDRDPAAVNALFNTQSTGLAAVVDQLVKVQTRSGDGILVSRQDSLNRRIKDIDDDIAVKQRRLTAFQENLVKQFTAMETTVSSLKSTGTFLTNWANQSSSSSK